MKRGMTVVDQKRSQDAGSARGQATGDRLKGKVAIVTGGGSGIGRAGSMLFARHGCDVAVADVNLVGAQRVADAITSQGGRAVPVQVDVRRSDQVRAMVETTEQTFGGVDILFTNAADVPLVNSQDKCVVELDESTFDAIHDVVLRGVFLCAKYAGQAMIRRGGGAMVLIATVDAQVGCAGLDAYTAAKGGVIALTRSMAAGLAKHGIRVNAISPGFVNTESQAPFMRDAAGRKQIQSLHLLPLPDPEDIVPLALFLASDEARSITGSIHQADAGYTAFKSSDVDIMAVINPEQP
ncbi:MAG: short-chain dehydrogenase [Planctomycetaceae bacterium]|nr:short-chain dehydrogenase [Planctomycetaceae bacterium]